MIAKVLCNIARKYLYVADIVLLSHIQLIHYRPDAGTVKLKEPRLDHLHRIVIPGNTDRLPAETDGIHQELHLLIQFIQIQSIIRS